MLKYRRFTFEKAKENVKYRVKAASNGVRLKDWRHEEEYICINNVNRALYVWG